MTAACCHLAGLARSLFGSLPNPLWKLQLPLEKGSYNNPDAGDMSIVLWDGTFVCTAKSARYPDRLVEKAFRVSFYVRLRNLKDQFGRNTFGPHYLTFKVGRFIAPHPRERIGLMNITRELCFDGREMRMVYDVFRRGVRSAAATPRC